MKDSIRYLEIQITDSCNLNCKGCSHCAGIMPPGQHIPLEHYERDLRRMRELTPGIRKIRILGGEPFLNPKLAEYLRLARAYFPESKICVVTNGLLCLQAKEEVYREMRQSAAAVDVSVYPPTKPLLEQLEKRFRKEEVSFTFSPLIAQFTRRLCPEGHSPVEETYENCPSNWCHFLRDGILCLCAAPVMMDFLGKTYGLEFDTCQGKLDLYQKGLTGEDVAAFLNRPSPVCRYCTTPEPFPWEGHAVPQITDWIAGREET